MLSTDSMEIFAGLSATRLIASSGSRLTSLIGAQSRYKNRFPLGDESATGCLRPTTIVLKTEQLNGVQLNRHRIFCVDLHCR